MLERPGYGAKTLRESVGKCNVCAPIWFAIKRALYSFFFCFVAHDLAPVFLNVLVLSE